jgi:hypothetical protein
MYSDAAFLQLVDQCKQNQPLLIDYVKEAFKRYSLDLSDIKKIVSGDPVW